MKAAELFVKCLEEEGVERIYGVPGEENADLMIALMDSKIDFILCRHEQAAAFMADSYGRLTGKAGVCLSTLGPGATNLVTGLADANMDRAPVVAIIGQGSTKRLHKESHQNMDSVAMMRPISKWAQSITSAGNITEVVRKAFKLAETEKPGVCVIELPEDIAKHDVDDAPMPARKVRRPGADYKAIAEAARLIGEAKNPIILAGNGAIRKRAAKQLFRLATKTGIGVVNTFMGKGAVPMDDPHCLFTMGLGSGDYNNLAFDDADLVISCGYDLVEYAPSAWNRSNKDSKKIIHIDFSPAEVDRDYQATVEVVGDLADALWQLNEAVNNMYADRMPLFNIADRQALRNIMSEEFAAQKDDTAVPVKPQKILWDVREFMGPEDILLSDVGAHKMWIARHYQCMEPNTCLISNGFCTMGFAMPGSIGAKMAFPDKKVLSISGDAGFMMNVQELETAVRLKLNVVAMIWCDGEYGLIKWKQQTGFQGRHSPLAFNNPDFVQLAHSFGMWGKEITATDQIIPTLKEAFAQEGPALIAIPVDYSENMKLSERLGNVSVAL
ncbi:MAG TPA: acetolactate synthase large subunit [Rhodospirillaceae bacterium]|nr:acetolactate synthase large subunit [Rhodospirillaceae bacterium]MBB55754.1 acetolactate synthase large subunit [Rhodospirillaceae bacterium]HBM14209.1 acetolactate synthase large subunit [Rhodospirillaceae bacterium]|tara:strand:+ start:192903 stop:194567 length:1665 start_codon:yes stop_codon:yes gene_type:complete